MYSDLEQFLNFVTYKHKSNQLEYVVGFVFRIVWILDYILIYLGQKRIE